MIELNWNSLIYFFWKSPRDVKTKQFLVNFDVSYCFPSLTVFPTRLFLFYFVKLMWFIFCRKIRIVLFNDCKRNGFSKSRFQNSLTNKKRIVNTQLCRNPYLFVHLFIRKSNSWCQSLLAHINNLCWSVSRLPCLLFWTMSQKKTKNVTKIMAAELFMRLFD